MQALAVIVAAVIAVVGWIVNQAFARRAIRRNLRIEYLLSAYRRLETACARPMTSDHAAAVEIAISDVWLLGSSRQIELAGAFAKMFATNGQVDADPLLGDLRQTLRSELLLEEVPPQPMWLRIPTDTG